MGEPEGSFVGVVENDTEGIMLTDGSTEGTPVDRVDGDEES